MNQVQTAAALQLVVDTLLETAAIQALVGNRIQGGWSRQSDLGTIGKPAVVIQPEGGDPHYTGTIAQLLIEVYAISGDGTAPALTLYDLCRDALNGNELCHDVNDHRGIAYEVERPRCSYVQEAGCWIASGRYSLTVARITP